MKVEVVTGLCRLPLNYEPFDDARAFIGSASSGDVDVEASYPIVFRSSPDRPIRLVILQDDNGIESGQETETPLLLERVELFTSP